jgi:hypothetical protein
MAIGRAMVDDEAWWTARPDANRRTAMADLNTAELGARRWRGHEAGGHANASAGLRIDALLLVILTWAVLTCCPTAADVVEPNYEAQRAQMIRTIETQVRDVSSAVGRDHIDLRVLKAMGALPRHEFVPEDLRRVSRTDRPLPIGYGQTISQPLIVALMTDVLNIDATSVVLEVGTGSGYQTAIIAELARQVYTIEIIADLAHGAVDRLHRLGYTKHYGARWGRLFRVAGCGSLRWNHCHRSGRSHPAATAAATEARRSHGNPYRPTIRAPASHDRGAQC